MRRLQTVSYTHLDVYKRQIPQLAAYDDVCTAADLTDNLGIGVGSLDSITDRCYTPTWSATGDTIVISGKYETT